MRMDAASWSVTPVSEYCKCLAQLSAVVTFLLRCRWKVQIAWRLDDAIRSGGIDLRRGSRHLNEGSKPDQRGSDGAAGDPLGSRQRHPAGSLGQSAVRPRRAWVEEGRVHRGR